jgi:predicted NBD/HSP70 family sugar kinase
MQDMLSYIRDLDDDSKKVFRVVLNNPLLTKNSIMQKTGLTLSTLNRVMKPLLDRNLVVPAGIDESTGGRKPLLYDVNPGMCYLLGIDISRSYTDLVLSNMKMDILAKRRFTMDETYLPDRTVSKIASCFEDMLSEAGLDKRDILGAGLGAVGPLDREKGVLINPDSFLAPGWSDVRICDMLHKQLGLTVRIDNGANCAVLLESKFGYGKDYRNVAYFNCGIGLRTGVINNGNIIRTMNNIEDAFGHMTVDIDGEKCHCGNYGCVEVYSSAAGIVKKYVSEVKKGRKSINKPLEKIGFIDICEAADEGDELSREVIIHAALVLGTGLANFMNLFNPDIIILSGPLNKHSSLYYEIASEHALKKSYLGDTSILFKRLGYFGDHAISLGAAAMFLQELLAQ